MADGRAPGVLFLGMAGAFSVPPLEAMLAAGLHVISVALPGVANRLVEPRAAGGLPVLTPYAVRTIVQIAWEHRIPVYEVADLRTLEVPEILAVACFDRLVPSAVRERANLAINVHPSLLPDNRGPAPLFWTFRLGQRRTGVTVHLLTDEMDAGDVLAQRAVPVPDGVEGVALEHELATIGGELLVQVIRAWEQGRLRPTPQDGRVATTHGWPSAEDWKIPEDWPPQRRANFTRGTAYLR